MSSIPESTARGSRTLLVLRLALTVAWAAIGTSVLVSPRIEGGAMAVASVAAMLVFITTLWACLWRAPHAHTRALTVVLLMVQVLSGILIATDFMFLVAIELPLVLRERHAAIGFVVLVALVMLVGFAEAAYGTFFAAPELAGMGRSAQVVLTMIMTAGWLLLAFAGGLLAATEIRAAQQVRRLMAELTLTNRALAESTREAERLHIARELHDTVGHRLAALGVMLDLESRRTTDAPAAALREARDATQDLLVEVRHVVSAMRQEQPLDVKRAIAQLVSGMAPLEAELIVSPGFTQPEPAASHALLRCTQEALTNVLRHATASRVRIELRADEHGVSLAVNDDGVGAKQLTEGHGLRGMRERIAPLGGTLSVTTKPGAGCEIVAWLPASRGGA